MASELKQLFKRQMNEDYYYDTTSEEETTVLPLIHFGKHLRKIIRISTLEPEDYTSEGLTESTVKNIQEKAMVAVGDIAKKTSIPTSIVLIFIIVAFIILGISFFGYRRWFRKQRPRSSMELG